MLCDASSYLQPIPAVSIGKGDFILLDGKTCKIVDFSHAKTGKHGHIKASLVGMDLIGKTKHAHLSAGHQMMYKVEVKKKDLQAVSLHREKNEVDLLDNNGTIICMDVEPDTIDTIKFLDEKDTMVTILTVVEGRNSSDYKLVEKIIQIKYQ